MKVGDIVTRDGTDRHFVVRLDSDGFGGDFLCVRAPSNGWIKVGEMEANLSSRYSATSDSALEFESAIKASICAGN